MNYTRDNDCLLQSNRNGFSIIVAKVYLFCLTFRMIAPLRSLESVVGSLVLSFDVIPHFLGLAIMIIQDRGKFSVEKDEEGKALLYFIRMVIWFLASSIIMAVIIQQLYGNYGNESAYKGIMGMLLYWTQYALIMLYNYHIFKLLTKSEIENSLKAGIVLLMIIGYFQMFVMTFKSLGGFYDRLDVFDVLNNSDKLAKLALTGPEGAYAGYIIGTLVVPFIYARNLSGKSKGNVIVNIILWIPLIYMTYSSGAYILFSAVTIGYLYLYVRKNGLSKSIIITLGIIVTTGVIVIFFGNDILNLLPSDMSSNIRYLLLEKIQDNDNGSTVLRSIPFYYNWGAFTEYPIIGVGNGLQGYFLEKYMPATFKIVKGIHASDLLKSWTSGIANGSLFWPSILSGYGIVGVILVIIYIFKSENVLRKKKEELSTMYFMYRLSLIGIVFAGFATDFVAKYYVWFAISIPLMSVSHNESIQKRHNNSFVVNYKYLK